MSRRDLLTQWLQEQLDQPGKSQQGLADALGIDRTGANRLRNGKRELKAAEVPLVERYFGARCPAAATSFSEAAPATPPDFVAVPVYDMRLGLEDGQMLADVIPLRYLMFDRSRLAQARAEPSMLVAFDDRGEELLVDTSRRDPRHEGTYILRIDSVLSRRAITLHPARRTLTLRSEDPVPAVFDDVQPDELDVIGRLIWLARFLP